MNYREVVFTVQVKSRCWKCPLTSTLVTHSSPSRCQIVCVRARPPQKRAFHRISRHLSWAALHLPICIDQTAFISPLHGGKKITIKKAKKEYQKKGRTSCKWEFTSEQRRLRLSAGDIMSCVTRQEDCCSRYLAACISSPRLPSVSLWAKNLQTCGCSCGLLSDTIHIHMNPLAAAPDCCWQG